MPNPKYKYQCTKTGVKLQPDGDAIYVLYDLLALQAF